MKLIKTLLLLSLLSGCASLENSLFNVGVGVERSMSGLEKKEIQLKDHNWAYLEAGIPSDPAVLLLHGFSADKDNWTRMVRHLDGFHVIVPDLPGHGDSSFDGDVAYGFEIQSQRLAEFVNAIGLSSFHLVGNSMGGGIAALYTHANPDKVTSLTLMDAVGFYGETASEFEMILENKGKNPLIVRQPEDMEVVMNFAMHQVPFMPWPATDVLARKAMEKTSANDYIFKHIMDDIDAVKHTGGYTKIFNNINVPSYVLWGEKDRVLDVSSVDKFLEHMPNVQTEILPDIGHLPMLENPEKTANLLQDFWKNANYQPVLLGNSKL